MAKYIYSSKKRVQSVSGASLVNLRTEIVKKKAFLCLKKQGHCHIVSHFRFRGGTNHKFVCISPGSIGICRVI